MRTRLSCFTLTIFLTLLSCRGEEEPANVVNVYLTQNEDKRLVDSITVEEYRQALARARLEREGKLNAAPLNATVKTALLDQMVDTKILLWKAKELKVSVSTGAVSKELLRMKEQVGDRELRKTLLKSYQRIADLEESIEERLTIGKLMSTAVHKKVQVEKAEVEQAWKKIPKEEKKVTKLVRARQIVVQTEEEANEIRILLRRGKDFEKLARERSISPESKRGGDLGWFEKGIMPAVFDEACFSLKLGQISAITPSEYGFHIFQVIGIEPERELNLQALRERIRSKLLHKKLQAAENKFLNRLRKQLEIVRDESLLARIN
ncbi:MAG: peptidylprolyl isomerase [Myxococcota bacterium]|nr:peptidylprolyl isomerase [Myxococcota bacterium]